MGNEDKYLLGRTANMYWLIYTIKPYAWQTKGLTPNEIAEQLVLPVGLDSLFACRGYYGSLSHNVKSQYQMYFGWFDGNPANLKPLPQWWSWDVNTWEAIGGRTVIEVARGKLMMRGISFVCYFC